jgi:hypothetical protein
MNKDLYRNLEHVASRGATLRELEAEIDNRRRLLSDVERAGAWLYAWALVKRHENHPIPTERRGQHLDHLRAG